MMSYFLTLSFLKLIRIFNKIWNIADQVTVENRLLFLSTTNNAGARREIFKAIKTDFIFIFSLQKSRRRIHKTTRDSF